jgi:hypothetical protein|tara:strand:+ start:449 stop:1114 length:666 start_codon:yes stop_codon:yes gene_type:complete
MEVKINKDGKDQKFNIIDSWEDVTLEKWAELVAAHKGGTGKANEALATIQNLSDMPKQLIEQFSLEDVLGLLSRLSDIQSRAKSDLRNKFTLNEVEYGFHPNLEEITLGEWADLETCITDGVNDNLAKIMAILYRPITETKDSFYTIEAYNTTTKPMRVQEFKKMPAELVESALVFFWSFVSRLFPLFKLCLTEQLKKNLNLVAASETQTKHFQNAGAGLV